MFFCNATRFCPLGTETPLTLDLLCELMRAYGLSCFDSIESVIPPPISTKVCGSGSQAVSYHIFDESLHFREEADLPNSSGPVLTDLMALGGKGSLFSARYYDAFDCLDLPPCSHELRCYYDANSTLASGDPVLALDSVPPLHYSLDILDESISDSWSTDSSGTEPLSPVPDSIDPSREPDMYFSTLTDNLHPVEHIPLENDCADRGNRKSGGKTGRRTSRKSSLKKLLYRSAQLRSLLPEEVFESKRKEPRKKPLAAHVQSQRDPPIPKKLQTVPFIGMFSISKFTRQSLASGRGSVRFIQYPIPETSVIAAESRGASEAGAWKFIAEIPDFSSI